MKQYKTLKDLPGIPAGKMGQPHIKGNYFIIHGTENKYYFSYNEMEQHKDFFEEVKEEPKLFNLSDMNSAYNCGYNRLITFGSFISKNFPHTKIDQ